MGKHRKAIFLVTEKNSTQDFTSSIKHLVGGMGNVLLLFCGRIWKEQYQSAIFLTLSGLH